jgi:hypothetical protein
VQDGGGTAAASCTTSEVLVGGGYSFPDESTVSPGSYIFKDGPNNNGHSWEIKYRGFHHSGSPAIVYAICATISPEDTNASP